MLDRLAHGEYRLHELHKVDATFARVRTRLATAYSAAKFRSRGLIEGEKRGGCCHPITS